MKVNNMKLNETTKKLILEAIKAIAIAALSVIGITLTSCGTTKATISKPAEGTCTTITITTNNPITTNTNPNINLTK